MPVVVSGIGPFYMALGKSKLLFKITTIRFFSLVAAMVIGWNINKANGVIVGMATYGFIMYFIDAYIQHKHSIWIWKLDLLAVVISVPFIFYAYGEVYPV